VPLEADEARLIEIAAGRRLSLSLGGSRISSARDLAVRVFFASRVRGSKVAQRRGGRRGFALGGKPIRRHRPAGEAVALPATANRYPLIFQVEAIFSSKVRSLFHPLAPSALSLTVPAALPTASPPARPLACPLLFVWVVRCGGLGSNPGLAVGRC
jgi:hypothetical protein